jgi:hypothetical protein
MPQVIIVIAVNVSEQVEFRSGLAYEESICCLMRLVYSTAVKAGLLRPPEVSPTVLEDVHAAVLLPGAAGACRHVSSC